MDMNTAVKRRVFYSFHYDRDVWRVNQVRNMGVVVGDEPVSPNDLEELRRKGYQNIQDWIDDQIKSCSCVIVLIGHETANQPWVQYEIQKAWATPKKGLAGIMIHNLENRAGKMDIAGINPFPALGINAPCYNPLSQVAQTGINPFPVGINAPYYNSPSKRAYAWIKQNLRTIVELAIQTRQRLY